MKKLTVTFCGQSFIDDKARIKELLNKTLKNIFEKHKDYFISFYCGGYGNFDWLARDAVSELRQEYGFNCEIVYVTPYCKFDEKYIKQFFDDTLFPPLETVPKRYAIIRRNFWMVDNSDILIAYTQYSLGGARKTLEYAERRFKNHGNPVILKLN